MNADRTVLLEGVFNARDLGGLSLLKGGRTRMGSLVRSEALTQLTGVGWDQLVQYGIRTIIDLRNSEERVPDICPRPQEFETIHIALDGGEDPEFWSYYRGIRFCTPVYYKPHLERFPEITASVLRAIATARDGGVLFHCGAGRDRTGLIAMVILHLSGVEPKDIADDHSLSPDNLTRLHRHLGTLDERGEIEAFLNSIGKSPSDLIYETLATTDIKGLLRKSGLCEQNVESIRRRLIE